MYFKTKEELLIRLKSLEEIGFGCQGTCYLDKETNKVYKIFNQYLDEDIVEDEMVYYNSDDILRFSNVKNNTFIFSEDVICIGNLVVGYINSYIKAKPLYKSNPLNLSLDKLISNIQFAYKDIEIISDKKIVTFDLPYNVLYGNRFYVTDTDEFGIGIKDLSYKDQNINNFNYELYLFLIDGYFNEFISNYNNLNKMYNNKNEDLLYFLKLFRKYLSEYLGKDIKYLRDANTCINKSKIKTVYERIII